MGRLNYKFWVGRNVANYGLLGMVRRQYGGTFGLETPTFILQTSIMQSTDPAILAKNESKLLVP